MIVPLDDDDSTVYKRELLLRQFKPTPDILATLKLPLAELNVDYVEPATASDGRDDEDEEEDEKITLESKLVLYCTVSCCYKQCYTYLSQV